MQARKIRYDESFIADDEQQKPHEPADIQSLGSSGASYVPSPARALHKQLEDQLGSSSAVKSEKKYSGLVSVSIIVGSCLVLWTGLISMAVSIYQ